MTTCDIATNLNPQPSQKPPPTNPADRHAFAFSLLTVESRQLHNLLVIEGAMEGIHGVDVSWLHHTPKGKHLLPSLSGVELRAIAISGPHVVRVW